MDQHIDAIFDNGVLRPLVPLLLPDQALVRLTIDANHNGHASIEPHDEWERQLLAAAKDCGVSLPDSALSSDELYE